MSQYFPPYRSSRSNIKVELDLSTYATKTDLKNGTHVHVSSFASKTNLASLKTEVDKIDVDRLKTVPVDLAKLSNGVKNDVIQKTEYNKSVTKVDNINTTNFVKKNKYEKDGSDFQNKISKVDKKIPDVSGLVKKTDFNSKITETESKIPNVSNFITKTNFNTKVTEIEGKMPDNSNLVTKADFDARLKKIVTELLQIKQRVFLLKIN